MIKARKAAIDFQRIWNIQAIDDLFARAVAIISAEVNEDLIHPPQGISNISEWAKKDGAWVRMLAKVGHIAGKIPDDFLSTLVSADDDKFNAKGAKLTQKIDDGIGAQTAVVKAGADFWRSALVWAVEHRVLSPTERGILDTAAGVPRKIPTEKQSIIAMDSLRTLHSNGYLLGRDLV